MIKKEYRYKLNSKIRKGICPKCGKEKRETKLCVRPSFVP